MRAEAEQPVGVVGRVDLVPQTQVGQVVYVDAVPEGDRNGVLSQLDPQDDLSEAQLADFLGQVVVPDQDPVGGRVGVGSSPHQGHEVAPEEHLDLADPAPEQPLDAEVVLGVKVVDAKAVGGPDREASAVLVEGDREELASRGGMVVGGLFECLVDEICIAAVIVIIFGCGCSVAAFICILKLAIVHIDGILLGIK